MRNFLINVGFATFSTVFAYGLASLAQARPVGFEIVAGLGAFWVMMFCLYTGVAFFNRIQPVIPPPAPEKPYEGLLYSGEVLGLISDKFSELESQAHTILEKEYQNAGGKGTLDVTWELAEAAIQQACRNEVDAIKLPKGTGGGW